MKTEGLLWSSFIYKIDLKSRKHNNTPYSSSVSLYKYDIHGAFLLEMLSQWIVSKNMSIGYLAFK